MRRRRLLLGLTMVPLAGLAPAGAAGLRAIADDLTRRDLAFGGAAVLADARAAAAAVLARGTHGDDAAAILDRAAWALRDAGAAGPGERRELLTAAEGVAEDAGLRTHIRLDRALTFDDADDPVAAVRALDVLLAEPAPTLQRAGLYAAAGRCAERAGETRAAVGYLEVAEGLHGGAVPDRLTVERPEAAETPYGAGVGDLSGRVAPVLGDAGQLPGAIGRGWLAVGDFRRAEAWLTLADAAYGPGRARGRASGLVRRAHARLALGDLGGCDADLAAAGGAGVASARLGAALRRVRRLRGLRG